MKKLLSLLVVTVMLLAINASTASIKTVSASETKDATMIAAQWNLAGYDRYGRPLLDGKHTSYSGVVVDSQSGRFTYTTTFPNYPSCDYLSGVAFPWQKPGQELWGRVQYYMPDARQAIIAGAYGRYNSAVTQTSPATWKSAPYLWAEVWLTVKAQGGESTLLDKRYVVMDNFGQVWIDPDGRFNDSRYWEPANPTSSYYRSSTILSGDGTSQWNDCRTNPLAMLDPSGENNTQGPYIFSNSYNPMTGSVPTYAYPAPQYQSRVYYWWYEEEQGIDRVWRLGWANQEDYLRRGAISVDGKTLSTGLVGGPNNSTPGAYYPGKPVIWNTQVTDSNTRKWTPNDINIMSYDWDCGVGLIAFSATERYVDLNNNNTFDFGEWVFLDNDTSNTFNVNDSRLVSYTIIWGGKPYNFRKGTNVGPTDEDLQWLAANPTIVARAFPANVMHASIPGLSLYDQIYIDADGNAMITPNDIRLTNINFRFSGYGTATNGLWYKDAFIMLELLETTCSYTYNVSVECDLWMAMEPDTLSYPDLMPSRTAASFKTINGDISQMAQLVNKATALDINGQSFYIPATTFYDLRAEYREFLGMQIFLDNGVDNNLANGLNDDCFAISLSDDHRNFLAGEQFVGSQDVETALDINLTLTSFSTDYLYFETNYDMRPAMFPLPLPNDLFYGCGEPFYFDLNKTPLSPVNPLQPDPAALNYNPGVVNVGDVRMIDMTISSGNGLAGAENVVTYKAGSKVAVGDLDYGRVITVLPQGMTYYDEPHGCEAPNKQYDVGELMYFDPARAGGTRAIRMIRATSTAFGGTGIETFTSGTPEWTNTTYPFGGTSGMYWTRAKAGYLAWNNIQGYPYQYGGWGTPTFYGPPMWQLNGINDSTFRIMGNAMTGEGADIMYNWLPGYPLGFACPSGGILYYNGPDQNGNPSTANFWNSYVFNYSYRVDRLGFYMKTQGMAAVLVQPNGATVNGYTATYYYDQNGWYVGYGWQRATNWSRIIVSRANDYNNNGSYARTVSISYYDPTSAGDMFPNGVYRNIQTSVSGNIWTMVIPNWGYDIQATLTGATSWGAAGLYAGGLYAYDMWGMRYYDSRAYWDNVEIYYVQSVPQPGDRRRLLAPGHWVGANGYTLKKNDAGKAPVTNSTNAANGMTPFGYFYGCGSKLAAGELYDVKSKVGMVTMGKNGDPRYMDIEVLPGKLKVNIEIDGNKANPKDSYQLKVEQTSDIKVTVDPAPKPGERYLVKYNDLYQAGIPATPAYVGYIETREQNTFTDSDPTETEVPKESFNTTGLLYYTFSDTQPAGGINCPQLALPFDFKLYNRTIATGTHILPSTNGFIRFDTDGYNTTTLYYYYMMRGAPRYTIAPLASYYPFHLGYSPLSGQQVNPNLAIFVSRPTAGSIKIRWATKCIYSTWYGGGNIYSESPSINFSVTLFNDHSIRFSYGYINDYYGQWDVTSCGIKGEGTYYSTTDTEYFNTSMHASSTNLYNMVDDIVLTRMEFPADPGRPAGGSTDQDYLIGSTMQTKIGPAVGGASVKTYEITPENPILHIQYTPYRGSCQENGTRDAIRIEVFQEKGGVAYPVPLDSELSGERFEIAQTAFDARYENNIYDPYWIYRPWSKKQYDSKYKGDKTPRPVPPASGIPTFACGLDDIYDCYGVFNLYVAPEDLALKIPDGGKQCISMNDLRYPNFTLQVFDADNVNDVNDPANILISTTRMQPGVKGKLIANVNAHGAGIEYLCTTMTRTPQNISRYIVQVNMDGSYTFWRWGEPLGDGPGAKLGALDPTDWVYSRRTYDGNTQSYMDITGYGNGVFMPWTDSDGFATGRFNSSSTLVDVDCSFGSGICDVCHLGAGFPNLGDVSKYDAMGRFNSDKTGTFNIMPASPSGTLSPAIDYETTFVGTYQGGRTYGSIETFGVPTMITAWSQDSEGGEVKLCLQPKNADTPLQIRVYLAGTIFDYNSALATSNMDTSNPTIHPPYFVLDDAPGIDYCGVTTVQVTPSSTLNFSEFRMIDHGLAGSLADYTAGSAPLSEMDRPTKQLRHWYNPICYNYSKDLRCYPGGQSHTARVYGSQRGAGWNAYPAINYNIYNKLGTEFYPLTDYGFYFALTTNTDISRAQIWDRWTFDPYDQFGTDANNKWRVIRSIEVTGPFMTPKRYYRGDMTGGRTGGSGAEERIRMEYGYNGLTNVPIQYDTSGYLRIDKRNSYYYELQESNWTNIISPGYTKDTHSRIGVSIPRNGTLAANRDLLFMNNNPSLMTGFYTGLNYFIFAIDEIIPIQPGLVQIKVTLSDGTVKIFQDCCQAPPTDGFVSHALGIKLENQDVEDRQGVIVDSGEITLNAVVTEEEKVDLAKPIANYNEWEYKECNDALVYAWQDRGVYDPDQKVWIGAGDGWCSGAPKNSTVFAKATQYMPEDDKSGDGRVSFYERETEILGDYDIATNTWSGAFIDARTFQRNNGKYSLKFSTDTDKNGEQKGLLTGFDFGGISINGTPLPAGVKDHVIGVDEQLPIWIVAYKYGDDNNDRTFRPLYDSIPNAVGSMSHEVYLSGTRKFDVLPRTDLQVTYGPEPLTAGFTPELQNVETPLTINVTDADGKPLKFENGIKDGFGNDFIDDDTMQTHLFIDPIPDDERYFGKGARLPQYYWIRTDLHNFDSSVWSNGMQYSNPDNPFKPIVFDSKDKANGKYKFYGFCANDAGEFDVYVYSYDRRHNGKVTVKVKQPHTEYKIRNYDNQEVFTDKGGVEGTDPDFVMTASDDRIYEVTVQAWDALGQLIKGTAKEVSVCSGSGSDTTRFTPYVTRPQNFRYAICINAAGTATYPGVAAYSQSYNLVNWGQIMQMMANTGDRFFPFYAIDFNNDKKIDPILNPTQEIGRFSFMHAFISDWGDNYDSFNPYTWGIGYYYFSGWSAYNTTNFRFDDGYYEVLPSWDLPPANMKGYGPGSIYNDGNWDKNGVGRYPKGVIFWDLNKDRILTFQDSLSFNQNGETSFFIYADDVFDLGGLVGNNLYSNTKDFSDVAGSSQWYSPLDPNYLISRYWHWYSWGRWYGTNDGGYRLDWDAFPDNNAKVAAPIVKCFNPENNEEMSKSLLSTDCYDLTYGTRNHILVKAYAADPRDVKMKESAFVCYGQDYDTARSIRSNSTETTIVGKFLNSESDPKAVETSVYITPDGTGADVSSLTYFRMINWQTRVNATPAEQSLYEDGFYLTRITKFDVCKGLTVKAEPLNKILKLGQPDTVVVTVTETGSEYPYPGVKVVMRAEDGSFELEAPTNDAGQAKFEGVKPTSLSKIFVKATKSADPATEVEEGRTSGYAILYVEEDRTPPSLDVNSFPALTNKSSITIEGTVTKNSKVKVGNVDAVVDNNGAWKANINLNQGENIINIVAVGPNGVPRSITIRIVLDKEPPVIILPTQAEVDSYNITESNNNINFRGRVTPGSKITANDIKAVQNGTPLTVSNVAVVNDVWTAKIENIQTGTQLSLTISAVDEAGNPGTSKTANYTIAKITTVTLAIGNAVPVVNGKTQAPLLEPVYLSANNPMIPLEEIAKYLEISVSPSGNSMTVMVGTTTATITVGSQNVVIGSTTVTLPVAPELKQSKIFVPASLVADLLKTDPKAEISVTYDINARTVVIKRIVR